MNPLTRVGRENGEETWRVMVGGSGVRGRTSRVSIEVRKHETKTVLSGRGSHQSIDEEVLR